MTERAAIERSAGQPATVASLASGLRALGAGSGPDVLVHSSLSALGWVCGGAAAVIEALLEAPAPGATLVMPAHSSDVSDPSSWSDPPVPDAWWPAVRAQMPAFDPLTTPTRAMGAVAELFRKFPDVCRSCHPTLSFAARGPRARTFTERHPLEDGLGPESPLAALYGADARILLLGVGHESNTSLHLAECLASGRRQERAANGAPLLRGGRRRWVEYSEPVLDASDFVALGHALERETSLVTTGPVAAATARWMPIRGVVDFARRWLSEHRDPDGRVATD